MVDVRCRDPVSARVALPAVMNGDVLPVLSTKDNWKISVGKLGRRPVAEGAVGTELIVALAPALTATAVDHGGQRARGRRHQDDSGRRPIQRHVRIGCSRKRANTGLTPSGLRDTVCRTCSAAPNGALHLLPYVLQLKTVKAAPSAHASRRLMPWSRRPSILPIRQRIRTTGPSARRSARGSGLGASGTARPTGIAARGPAVQLRRADAPSPQATAAARTGAPDRRRRRRERTQHGRSHEAAQ